MASEACPICGEEADADELDPHGHFDTEDDDEGDAPDMVHYLVLKIRGNDKTACGLDAERDDIDDGASTSWSDVSCSSCLLNR